MSSQGTITISATRYSPEQGSPPRMQSYTSPYAEDMGCGWGSPCTIDDSSLCPSRSPMLHLRGSVATSWCSPSWDAITLH